MAERNNINKYFREALLETVPTFGMNFDIGRLLSSNFHYVTRSLPVATVTENIVSPAMVRNIIKYDLRI